MLKPCTTSELGVTVKLVDGEARQANSWCCHRAAQEGMEMTRLDNCTGGGWAVRDPVS